MEKVLVMVGQLFDCLIWVISTGRKLGAGNRQLLSYVISSKDADVIRCDVMLVLVLVLVMTNARDGAVEARGRES